MSTLLVDELKPGVVIEQKFKITKDISIAHIRPWVYLHGTLADGQLQLTVLQGATSLITIELDYTEINEAKIEPYAHGSLRLDFDNLILHVEEDQLETEYTLRFEMINHTFDSANFIGLVRRWEAKTYPTYGNGVSAGEAINDAIEPFGLEIYEYKLRR